MKTILSTYEINEKTYGLFPARAIDYDTIVLEEGGIKYVRETPFNLIKQACLSSWSDYEGRRRAVIHRFNFQKRTPIPINKRRGLYFFPTHGQTNKDNSWIAFRHIKNIDEEKKSKDKNGVIVFHDGQTAEVGVSAYTLQNQLGRSFAVKFQINQEESNR